MKELSDGEGAVADMTPVHHGALVHHGASC